MTVTLYERTVCVYYLESLCWSKSIPMTHSQPHFSESLNDETVCAEKEGKKYGYKFFEGNLQRIQFLFIHLYTGYFLSHQFSQHRPNVSDLNGTRFFLNCINNTAWVTEVRIEFSILLWYDATSLRNWSIEFRDSAVVLSSRFERSSSTFLASKIWPLHCLKILGMNLFIYLLILFSTDDKGWNPI